MKNKTKKPRYSNDKCSCDYGCHYLKIKKNDTAHCRLKNVALDYYDGYIPVCVQ